MKKLAGLILLVMVSLQCCYAQPVKGFIIADTNHIKIIKVWGSHYERGFAYGYLVGNPISTLAQNYVKPMLGGAYTNARNIILAANDLVIDSLYKVEAQGIIDGMTASGTNTYNLDATDLLVSNSLLDVAALLNKKSKMGCSSLMSWGAATSGTTLAGKSVISRHLDWSINSYLVNNQVIVIHLPSEPDEQKWLLIGYAGMFSALSGVNKDFGAFQHMMDDYSSGTIHNQHLSPIWFTLRKALEKKDFNGDGHHNVQDVRAALDAQAGGFSDGYIISALSRSTENVDSLVAMVAEVTPASPSHTYRYNDFPDSIPATNLYTANYQIKRNHAMNFCSRYNGIRAHIGDGLLIDLDTNWILMRDYSHLSTNNQFMQFAPEESYLRISDYRNSLPAYQNAPIICDLNTLFMAIQVVPKINNPDIIQVYPNPAGDRILIPGLEKKSVLDITIFDANGKLLRSPGKSLLADGLGIHDLPTGIYFLSVNTKLGREQYKFIKK